MDTILLTNEGFIRNITNIDDNISSKFLTPAILEAQEIDLRQCIGDSLLRSLKDKVKNKAVSGVYTDILDQIQYYLAYQVASNVCVKVNYKIANAGCVQTSDDHVNPIDWDTCMRLRDQYMRLADSFKASLQRFLLQHRTEIPELSENKAHEIQSCLYSAASAGLWLGGARNNVRKGNKYNSR